MEIKLNLTSKPYLNRQAVRLWLFLACILLLLLFVFNALYGFQIYREMNLLKERFHELEGQLATAQADTTGYTPEKLATLKSEIALAREIVTADQFHWTRLLSSLEELVPENVSLRTIQPDFKAHSVKIGGYARNVSAMTQFIDNLLGSEDLHLVFLENHGDVESDASGMPQRLTSFSLVIREAF